MREEENATGAANASVNPDAHEEQATAKTDVCGSGSTFCSFSATDYQTPEPYRSRIIEAIGINGFKPICLDKDTTGQAIASADWVQELFQPVIDRFGLKCGATTSWCFKIHEWDFILATLHLEGKYRDGLPLVD